MTDRVFGSPGEWNLMQCTSHDCGLIWQNPAPSFEELSKAYENYYTHAMSASDSLFKRIYNKFRLGYLSGRFGYSDAGITWLDKLAGKLIALLPHRRSAFDSSVMWLDALQEGELLEIGCGRGERMALLSQLGWNTHGLEPDASAAMLAQKAGLQVSVNTLDEAQLPSDSFDAIIMSHVIEHLPAPQWVVKECLRILRPGGRLVMLTPNTDSLGHRWYGRDWLHLDPPRHLFLFNRTSMHKIFEETGYSDVSCQTVLRDANWTLAASRALQKSNRYTFGSLPVREKLYALVQLYYEWIRMKVTPYVGEELLLMARK